MSGGKRVWYFADGYLPEKVNNGPAEAHEALMFFNTHEQDSEVTIDIYFSDREPVKGIKVNAPAERVIALRLDHPEDLAGTVIPPLTQYALRITSELPIVSQFGRVDTTQNAMSYYVGVGHAE
ncbi:MAG: sensory rhodopsin transducer [Lentisphaerae bacterium]|nr:sensory rhodopsin transducer [Lentisphaerota bacterium]